MNASTLIQLPPELLPMAADLEYQPRPAGLPVERLWASALALVAACVALAFALPV